MSSTEGSFSSDSRVISTIIVEGADIDRGAEIVSKQASSRQDLFEGIGLTIMDSNRRLRCLSQNVVLNFEAMSHSSSSSSQTMGDTTLSTPISGSLSKAKEDEDDEEDEVDGEDKGAGGRVFAL